MTLFTEPPVAGRELDTSAHTLGGLLESRGLVAEANPSLRRPGRRGRAPMRLHPLRTRLA